MLFTVFQNSTMQLMYNLIHWFLGFMLVVAALLAYRYRHRKNDIRIPLIHALGGFIFMADVLGVYVFYTHKWHWPWQISPEQTIHFTIGLAWFIGGMLTALAKKKVLPPIALYALPMAMVFGGVRFFQPHQHGTSGGDGYLIIFHSILGGFLVASAICVFLTYRYWNRWKWLPKVTVLIGVMPGLILLTYRDQPTIHSNCAGKSNMVMIDVGKHNQPDKYFHLCDTIKLVSSVDKSTAPIFGDHHHHSKYSSYETKIIDKHSSDVFSAKLAGKFDLHDHISGEKIVTMHVDTHPTDPDWVLYKY